MTLTSTLILTHKNPARDNVEHVSKHASLAITSYPKQFSFKKGRIKSISSLFSSFSIGSRRTYSSKEKSVLHFKAVSLACFSWAQKTELLIVTPERKDIYNGHARSFLKIALTTIIYSSKEHKYLWSISSKECYSLMHFIDLSLFANLICHIFFSQSLYLFVFSLNHIPSIKF